MHVWVAWYGNVFHYYKGRRKLVNIVYCLMKFHEIVIMLYQIQIIFSNHKYFILQKNYCCLHSNAYTISMERWMVKTQHSYINCASSPKMQ